MVKAFKFMLQFAWINLGSLLAFAVIVVAGSLFSGVPIGANNLFTTYFRIFPLMSILILFVYAFALCTSNLNLALSFGSTRRGFFLALQGIMLLYTAICWALQLVFFTIPRAFAWTDLDVWSVMLSLGGMPHWIYPLLCMCVLLFGCLCGLIFCRSRVWGTIFIIVGVMVVLFGVMALTIAAHADFVVSLGGLAVALSIALVVTVAVCEGLIYRKISRFVVR